MYKIKLNIIPANLKSFFTKNSDIHSYETRNANKYHLSNPKTSLAQKTIKHRGPDIWNSLPDHITQCKSLNSFKYSLKNHILSSYS